MNAHDGEVQWAVTTYSFTNELMEGDETPDEVIGSVARSGIADAIEVDGAQQFTTFPMISHDEASRTRDAMQAAGVRPTLLGVYGDIRIDARGPRTPDELRVMVLQQAEAASTIGCFGIRVGIGSLSSDVLESLVPDLERLELTLLEEVQAGARPDAPVIDRHRELVSRLDTDVLGFVFDSSIVMPALPVTWIESLLGSGVPQDVIEATDELWRSRKPDGWDTVRSMVAPLDVPGAVLKRLEMPFRRFGCSTVAEWSDFLRSVDMVHLKYWDLVDDDERVSAPIRQIRAGLDAAGYSGFVCSEWGGHDWLEADTHSAFDMTREHHVMYDAVAP